LVSCFCNDCSFNASRNLSAITCLPFLYNISAIFFRLVSTFNCLKEFAVCIAFWSISFANSNAFSASRLCLSVSLLSIISSKSAKISISISLTTCFGGSSGRAILGVRVRATLGGRTGISALDRLFSLN
jgi:hypothetical protein